MKSESHQLARTAIYDLGNAPITCDFVYYLAAARLYFISTTGQETFDLIILADRFRNVTSRERLYTLDQRKWRVDNLIVPIASLAPCITSLTVTTQRHSCLRDLGHVFPPKYNENIATPASSIPYSPLLVRKLYQATNVDPCLFRINDQALQKARNLLKSDKKKTALLSLRSSPFESFRNTSDEVYGEFAKKLNSQGICPVIMPDQDSVGMERSQIGGDQVTVAYEASHNLQLRFACHMVAEYNIFPCTGFSQIVALAQGSPHLIIHDLINPSLPYATFDGWKRQGLDTDTSKAFPWTRSNQWWNWNEAGTLTADSLERVFQLSA